VIDYARPFKQIGKQMRLDEDEVIPEEHWESHERVIILRDKVFAHVDTDKFKDNDAGQVHNKLIVEKHNGRISPRMRRATLSRENIQEMSPLLSHLTTHCADTFTEILNKYSGAFPEGAEVAQVDVLSQEEIPLFTEV